MKYSEYSKINSYSSKYHNIQHCVFFTLKYQTYPCMLYVLILVKSDAHNVLRGRVQNFNPLHILYYTSHTEIAYAFTYYITGNTFMLHTRFFIYTFIIRKMLQNISLHIKVRIITKNVLMFCCLFVIHSNQFII